MSHNLKPLRKEKRGGMSGCGGHVGVVHARTDGWIQQTENTMLGL